MEKSIGKYRWTICSLVFFATTVNYLDRQVISLLKKTLSHELNWSETDYGNIVIAFQVCYALGLLGAGGLIDKIGTKIGYALTAFLWSIAAMAHALASTTFGFGVARAALGITEAGNFPAAIKTIAEWFPKKERALATGIFNSGANIGAIIAPLTVPLIAEFWGWQWAFIITGAIGFIWLILWFIFYETPAKQKRLSKAEFDYIHSDKDTANENPTEKVAWSKLLQFKQTWAFALGKFMTDPVWWFFLFWLPDFLDKEYGISGTQASLPIAVVYTLAAFGSVFGGWLPIVFIKKNFTVFNARRTSMLIYALCVLPVVFAQWLGSINMWFAVLIVGLATAAHQAWSANIYTTVSDMFPKKAVGSITGIGGMFGAIGGIIIARLAPKLFEYFKAINQPEMGYYIMFIICGLAYLAAWLLMRALVPKEKAIQL